MCHLHSCSWIETPVHLDEQLTIGPYGVPHCLDQCHRFVLLCSIQFVKSLAKGVKLERSIAFLDHTPGSLVKFVGSAFDRVPAIGVGLDAIADSTAEELIHWLTE